MSALAEPPLGSTMTVSEFSARDRARLDHQIAESRAALHRAESVVESLVDAGAISTASKLAHVAARRAWLAHPGVFTSSAIESALGRGGARLDGEIATARWRERSRGQPRVLHVATDLPFPVGGHGRLLERWIRSDTGRAHSVVVTFPRRRVPAFLKSTIEASGGRIYGLAPGPSFLVERARHLRAIAADFAKRARHLRALAADFDAVVLHTHPWDALPVLALAWPGRPPTIMSNHAPHVFWLGRAVSDVVVCGRQVAATMCTVCRGIPPEACFVQPVPVETAAQVASSTRDQVRRELGVADGELLLLTVASALKLRPVGGRDVVETIAGALSNRTDMAWRVVGPTAEGRWAEVAKRTRGRVRAVGERVDRGLYGAADAYIDSYPFTGRTALLDAAAAGLPLLAPKWHSPEAEILGAWGGSVDSAILPFVDEASLAQWLDALADQQGRQAYGRAAAEAISGSLTGAPWAAKLQDAYELAIRRTHLRDPGGMCPHLPLPGREPGDLDYYLRRLYTTPRLQGPLINGHRRGRKRLRGL